MGITTYRITHSIVALAITGLVAGCAPAMPEESAPRSKRTFANYDSDICKLSPDQGSGARLALLNVDEIVTSHYFQKRFDKADLDAVKDASLNATADYVRAMGVGVYRIRRTQGTVCPMFACLDDVPDDFQRVWDVHASKYPTEGVLAGLYFEYCDDDCLDRALTKPTILVDEAADRWTLVHEMMHHNFNRTRKGDPAEIGRRSLEKARNDSLTKFNDLNESYGTASHEEMKALVQEAKRFAESQYKLLVRTDFEEIAVEGLLVEAYARGELGNVTADAARSAVLYMAQSHQRGMAALNMLNDELAKIHNQAIANSWADIAQTIQSIDAFIRRVDRGTRSLVESAAMSVGLFDLPPEGHARILLSSSVHSQEDEHAHIRESKESRERFEREKARLRIRLLSH